jgi:hypothetical protein
MSRPKIMIMVRRGIIMAWKVRELDYISVVGLGSAGKM